MIHQLKTWPQYFQMVANGFKTFEVRQNDRDFRDGDTLVLTEYDPSSSEYTGEEISAQVLYVLHGPCFGIEAGYCVMAIKPNL